MTLTTFTLLLTLSQDEAPPPAPTIDPKDVKALTDAAQKLTTAVERLTQGPPPPPSAPPEKLWTANVSLGLTWVTGNATSTAVLGSGAAMRKSERTIFAIKASGGYGEKLDDAGLKEVIVYNAGLGAQLDYRFTPFFSTFVGGGLDTDHVKSVELRGYGELGAGALILDRKAGDKGAEYQLLLLKLDLGARVQPERRFQYYPTPMNVDDTLFVGPRVAGSFRYAVSAATYLAEEVEFLPNVLSPRRFIVNTVTKASVAIVAGIAASGTFTVKYDSDPALGKRPTDTILTVGLDANY